MIRDILIGAKREDQGHEFFNRETQTRIWCRETNKEKWRQIQDENQSLYELGLHEHGEILCEFQVIIIFLNYILSLLSFISI